MYTAITAFLTIDRCLKLKPTRNHEWSLGYLTIQNQTASGEMYAAPVWALVKNSAGLALGNVQLTAQCQITSDRQTNRLKIVILSLARKKS